MSSLLKDLYSPSFYERFANSASRTVSGFNKQRFMSLILNDHYPQMELKDRMRHTSAILHQFMPKDFSKSAQVIEDIIAGMRKDGFGEQRLEYMFLPDYIETYGIYDFKSAIEALEFVTQFVSCEFAVRPFLLKYQDEMIRQMEVWSHHESVHVRRLASEGSRPRLPWAMAIPALKKDPSPILAILENLRTDPSEYVRRSVANSLNDIAKDHPQIVLKIAEKWKGESREIDAIIKHGSRTLLKQGHAEILKHYGLESHNVSVSQFKIQTPEVKIGDNLEFSFVVTNGQETVQTLRLEYALYYKKANGQLAKKVFKISERPFPPGGAIMISRKQSFRLITTRTFYPGVHQLSVIVNGEEKVIGDFELLY